MPMIDFMTFFRPLILFSVNFETPRWIALNSFGPLTQKLLSLRRWIFLFVPVTREGTPQSCPWRNDCSSRRSCCNQWNTGQQIPEMGFFGAIHCSVAGREFQRFISVVISSPFVHSFKIRLKSTFLESTSIAFLHFTKKTSIISKRSSSLLNTCL